MSEWISVDDRLPDGSGRYWCYVEGLTCLGVFYEQDNCSFNAREKRWGCELWKIDPKK